MILLEEKKKDHTTKVIMIQLLNVIVLKDQINIWKKKIKMRQIIQKNNHMNKPIKRIKSSEITNNSEKFKLSIRGDKSNHNTHDDISGKNNSKDLSNNYSRAVKTLKKAN